MVDKEKLETAKLRGTRGESEKKAQRGAYAQRRVLKRKYGGYLGGMMPAPRLLLFFSSRHQKAEPRAQIKNAGAVNNIRQWHQPPVGVPFPVR